MALASENSPMIQAGHSAGPSRLIHFQAALAEIIAEWQPLETTVARTLEALTTGMPGCMPAFFRFSSGRFVCLSALRAPVSLLESLQGLRVPERDICDAGEAPFWSCEPKASDIRTDGAWTWLRPSLCQYGLAGCWSWPVFSPSGEALGVLTILRTAALPPGNDETDLLNCAVRILALIIEQRLLMDDLRYQAEHDALTGAVNSVAFQKLLDHENSKAEQNKNLVSLVCLNVDRIRTVNDLLGRNVGDRLLRDLASRVISTLDPEDTLARTDGSEFVVLLRSQASQMGALEIAARIGDLLQPPFLLGESEIQLRASIGLASYPEHAANLRSLLQAAQATVRRIRNSGRNRVEICDPRVDYADVNRARLESALQRAVERGELLLYYQPKVRLRTGLLDSAEALMRWGSAELGLISPSLFIPLAEETGEIVNLGRWAIAETCRQAALWDAVTGRPQCIAVNVSPVQLSQSDLVAQLQAAIKASGVDPLKIEVEITESGFSGDFSMVRKSLQTLRELGVRIALDDFGTGYSSLSVLRELPFDTLKIDKSFLDAASAGAAPASAMPERMLARMIDLGHDLGKTVVVEGVETQAQVDLLLELNCDIAQGYFFGRPIPAADWDAKAGLSA
jgi:diguanylate cyclase (GGDEF)-like protein